MADAHSSIHPDSPEARHYNRVRRWLGIGDFALGFAFLVILLVTRWSDSLRDLAYRLGFQNYSFSLFVYLVLLLGISKALGIGVDYYGFRLERRFKLSNQRFSAWAWDEIKGFLLGLVLGAIVVELVYLSIRQWPLHWWILAWALFMGLFVFLAQLAPVVQLPARFHAPAAGHASWTPLAMVSVCSVPARRKVPGTRRTPTSTRPTARRGRCRSSVGRRRSRRRPGCRAPRPRNRIRPG